MKEYSLFIDDAVAGPFPQAEIEAKIKSGELPADVLIAAPGDTEWKPAKDVLNIRMGVRLSRKSAEEEKRLREAREEKLDPDVRKKLMLYDLADAISVDKFSPEQAAAAIALYESNQAKAKYTKIGVGVGAFALTFCAIFFTLDNVKLSGINRSLLAPITEMMVAPRDDLPKQVSSTARGVEDFEKFHGEINALEFKMPQGGRSPERDFVRAVYIPKEASSFITGKIDASPLLAAVLPAGQKVNSTEIFFVARVSSEAKKALEEEIKLRSLLKTPLWTDAELAENAMQALGDAIPTRDSAQVNHNVEELRKRLGQLRANTIEAEPGNWAAMLEGEVNRQDSQGRFYNPVELKRVRTRQPDKEMLSQLGSSKLKKEIENLPKDSPSKLNIVRWCVQDMPPFLDKFQKFVDDNRLSYSQAARDALWKEFLEKNQKTIVDEFEVASMQSFPVAEDGSFRIARDRDSGMCLAIRVGDSVLYVPSDLKVAQEGAKSQVKAFSVKDANRIRVKQEDMLMDEKYNVVKKIAVGGKTYFANGKINGRQIPITRKSPVLYYIEVERQGLKDPKAKNQKNICLRVPDEEAFNGMSVGMPIPMEQLLKYEMFQEPREAQAPSKLALLPQENAESEE